MAKDPVEVTVEQLLADPDTHAGHRVTAIGFLRVGREELALGSVTRPDRRIWISLREGSPAGRTRRDKLTRVTGIFETGPAGHLDRYEGQLSDVEQMKRHRG